MRFVPLSWKIHKYNYYYCCSVVVIIIIIIVVTQKTTAPHTSGLTLFLITCVFSLAPIRAARAPPLPCLMLKTQKGSIFTTRTKNKTDELVKEGKPIVVYVRMSMYYVSMYACDKCVVCWCAMCMCINEYVLPPLPISCLASITVTLSCPA